jgi:hypothetical protein
MDLIDQPTFDAWVSDQFPGLAFTQHRRPATERDRPEFLTLTFTEQLPHAALAWRIIAKAAFDGWMPIYTNWCRPDARVQVRSIDFIRER